MQYKKQRKHINICKRRISLLLAVPDLIRERKKLFIDVAAGLSVKVAQIY